MCEELKYTFKSIKKPCNLILDNWNLWGNTILKVINTSLETGVFQNVGKNKAMECEEFRPSNTMKILEKAIAMVAKMQLEQYLEDHRLISKHQFGFRKNYSCETAVNYIINRWKYKKAKQNIGSFLGIQKGIWNNW